MKSPVLKYQISSRDTETQNWKELKNSEAKTVSENLKTKKLTQKKRKRKRTVRRRLNSTTKVFCQGSEGTE